MKKSIKRIFLMTGLMAVFSCSTFTYAHQQGHHMGSPAQKHFNKVMAAEEAKKAGSDNTVDPQRSQYELMLGKLAIDKKRLKTIKSIEKKETAKVDIVKEYDDYLYGVLASEANGIQDDVLTQLMLWNIDAGNYERALVLGKYAISHDIAMPPTHDRSTDNALVEEIADRLLKGDAETLIANESIIMAIMDIAVNSDQHDQVTAKIYKAAGIICEKSDPTSSLAHYKRALELNDKIGVKQVITKLEKKLADHKADDSGSAIVKTGDAAADTKKA